MQFIFIRLFIISIFSFGTVSCWYFIQSKFIITDCIILHIITISTYITVYRDIFWYILIHVEIYLNIRYKYEHTFFWSWMFLFIYILFTSTIHYTSSKYLLNILPLYFSIILYIISISIYITIYRDIFGSKSRSI